MEIKPLHVAAGALVVGGLGWWLYKRNQEQTPDTASVVGSPPNLQLDTTGGVTNRNLALKGYKLTNAERDKLYTQLAMYTIATAPGATTDAAVNIATLSPGGVLAGQSARDAIAAFKASGATVLIAPEIYAGWAATGALPSSFAINAARNAPLAAGLANGLVTVTDPADAAVAAAPASSENWKMSPPGTLRSLQDLQDLRTL